MENKAGRFAKLSRVGGDKWERFDSFPRHVKEALWECHRGTLTFTRDQARTLSPRQIRESVAKLLARDCLETYGPDHPQAEQGTRYAEADALLKSIGL